MDGRAEIAHGLSDVPARHAGAGAPPRRAAVSVKGKDFPALGEVARCLEQLPRNEAPLQATTAAQNLIDEAAPETLTQQELHTFIDQLQLRLAAIGDGIIAAYFSVRRPVETARPDTAAACAGGGSG